MPGAIYLAGPTASGKSAAAILVAERLNGEIISVDSMQVYRGMDIGTAKATPQERARVRHHLIDIAEPSDGFDAAHFLALAQPVEAEIRARGRLPIFCGGTGLYFKALIAGIGESPASDPELRLQLEATPLPALLDELAKSDPETFARIDRSNPRRVIRAVEVIRTSGCPFSAQRSNWKQGAPAGLWIGLARERTDLNRRINDRVESMFATGLVEETRELLKRGLAQNRTAMQAIGYRQVVEHLRGERDLRTTVDLVKQKSRQYAKRQMTWFRHQLDLQWIEVTADTVPGQIASEILLRFPL
jgi:tRNA dimethylallyltransferase